MLLDLIKQLLRNRGSGLIKLSDRSYLSAEYDVYPSYGARYHQLAFQQQVLIHIPKTAGTTFDRIIGSLCECYPLRFWRARGGVDSSHLSWNDSVALNNLRAPENSNKRAAADFISGHFPFSPQDFPSEGTQFISVVREPLAQVSSYYRFLQQRDIISPQQSLQLLLSQERLLDNMQVRQLAGEQYLHGECNQQTFDAACANIQHHFSLVGTSERFTDFMSLWLTHNHFPTIVCPKYQVTGNTTGSPHRSSLSELVDRYFAWDQALYRFASEQFEQQYQTFIRQLGDNNGAPLHDQVVFLPAAGVIANESRLMSRATFEKEHGSTIKLPSSIP